MILAILCVNLFFRFFHKNFYGKLFFRLATDIFVLFAEHKFEKDLLTALNGALVDSLETEVKLERIKLSSWKMQSNRSAFIKMAFRIHSAVIENHHPGIF